MDLPPGGGNSRPPPEDDLPSYESVSEKKFNYAEFTVLCRLPDGSELEVPTSAIDSVRHFKERLVTVCDHDINALVLRINDKYVLDDEASVTISGFCKGCTVDVCVANGPVMMAPPTNADSTHIVIPTPPSSPQVSTVDEEPEEEDSPPTYESLASRLDTAARNNSGVGFVKEVVLVLLGFTWMSILFAGALIVPIGLIVTGAIYVNDCPAQKQIPVWNIVFGVTVIVLICISRYLTRLKKKRQRQPDNHSIERTITSLSEMHSLIETFTVIWLLVGTWYVYGCNRCRVECNRVVFDFAFWSITGILIIAVSM